ncbi:MAG: hypothetical protein EKK41_16935 [Hyphomicrobiales bacterium]|nr:MAG: hypothetical protein EKK41_16935 [Hyphomicrobiales bacterium]
MPDMLHMLVEDEYHTRIWLTRMNVKPGFFRPIHRHLVDLAKHLDALSAEALAKWMDRQEEKISTREDPLYVEGKARERLAKLLKWGEATPLGLALAGSPMINDAALRWYVWNNAESDVAVRQQIYGLGD